MPGLIGLILLIGGSVLLFFGLKIHSKERATVIQENPYAYDILFKCPSLPFLLLSYISGTILTILGLIFFLIGILSSPTDLGPGM